MELGLYIIKKEFIARTIYRTHARPTSRFFEYHTMYYSISRKYLQPQNRQIHQYIGTRFVSTEVVRHASCCKPCPSADDSLQNLIFVFFTIILPLLYTMSDLLRHVNDATHSCYVTYVPQITPLERFV
jgi:hypothetical protein